MGRNMQHREAGMNEAMELDDLAGLSDLEDDPAEGALPEEETPYRCGCANCRKLRGTGRGGEAAA